VQNQHKRCFARWRQIIDGESPPLNLFQQTDSDVLTQADMKVIIQLIHWNHGVSLFNEKMFYIPMIVSSLKSNIISDIQTGNFRFTTSPYVVKSEIKPNTTKQRENMYMSQLNYGLFLEGPAVVSTNSQANLLLY
jgi:hypothetical protein